MGSADLVPGVSGGTIALIVGIYPRLVTALASFTRAEVRSELRARRWGAAWRAVDGAFLVYLVLGILTAVAGLSRALGWMLEHQREPLYAAFFGLVAASAVLVAARAGAARFLPVAAGVVAAAATFLIVGGTPRATPDAAWVLVLVGAVAVSALLLPGVSGAYLLVLFGKYDAVLGALERFDVGTLAPLVAGMGLGVLAFARLLSWLLARHGELTMAILAGVLVGSLRKVWPWQSEVGAVVRNVAPPGAAEAAFALIVAVAAAGVVAWVELASRRTRGTRR